MTTLAPSPAVKGHFIRVLNEFKGDLSQDEIQDFSFVTSDDLKKAVHRLQEQQKSEKRMQNLRRLSAFVEAMDQFDKVIQVFLNTSDFLGFIWGPAKFMLLIAGSHADALNTLLDAYQEISEHMPLLARYEAIIISNPNLQEIVGLIYKDILNFHRKAMKHFRQRAWKQLFHATWRTFRTDFGAIISNLQSHRRLLDSQAIFEGVQETLRAMDELHKTRRILEAECKIRQEQDAKVQHLAVISWLAAADSASDHEDSLAVQEKDPDSGRWLLEQDLIKDWVNSHPLSVPVLWINGKPGAGKTILASKLIEECRCHLDSAVAFFYCKHGDPSRDNFIGFARSIILQLIQLQPLLMPLVFEKQAKGGTESLRSSKIAKEILAVALESFDDLVIIIDGLDECTKSQKDEISVEIRSLVASAERENSRNLRCCFLSQDDNDMGRLLKALPMFKITEEHNKEDILRFCQRRASEIGLNFSLPSQDIQSLKECVSRNSDGMFLYAKLVMENLDSQVSKSALKQEMTRIPPNLNEVYCRIRHRILDEASPPEQQVAKTILSWLLCAKRPLKWHEIQGVMSLDLEHNAFDVDRRLIRDIKHFCGSLVEIRKEGMICFVHLTAKYFLQDEPTLPRQLEELNLTRLCFSYLSLDSHDSDVTKDMIRGRALRGEYAFTEYAVIHAFDHLLSVVSGIETGATLEYRSLRETLRTFITKRVNAPKNRAVIPKPIERILQVFKSEDFFHSLKHAIVYHKYSQEEATENVDEAPVLALLAQLARVRSVMENMIVFSNLGTNLKPIYGPNLFKCSEPQCESFYQGFPTMGVRDNHYDTHARVFFCTSSGCQSSMIGFSTAAMLKKHEQDYHQELYDINIFPWHGTLEKLNINEEVKKGNYAAFELWSSQWENLIPFGKVRATGDGGLMYIACRCGQEKILMELLHRVDWGDQASKKDQMSKEIEGEYCLQIAMNNHQEEVAKALIRHFSKWQDKILYRRLGQALNIGWDVIAFELLTHPSSPVLETSDIRKARRASYLNLAIRYQRDAVVRHILDTNNVDPEQQDDRGRTSLVAAAEFDWIEIALSLIKTKNCNKWARAKLGVTPLSMAGCQGHEGFIASIFPEKPLPVEVQKWLKTAQLRNAARDGNEGRVKELFHENLVRPDEVDMQHYSPWLWAVKGGHSHVVALFLSRPDIMFLRQIKSSRYSSTNGYGALHIAAFSGNDSLMQLLLKSGKFNSELGRSAGRFAKPLDTAKANNHTDTVKVIEDHMASLKKQEHQETLTSMVDLASTYQNQGPWKEAEELEVQAIERRKSVLGEEHLDTLSSIASLALEYKNQGRWKEAEELEVLAIERRESVLREEHLDTLNSIASLALEYKDQGRWKEAEELEVQVMETRKRVFGEEHSDTLASMDYLALTYNMQGKCKEAEELEMQVIETRKRVLGEEHPDTLSSVASLASEYKIQGRWKEAEALEVQVMETRIRVLEKEHPDTLISMVNLAHTWKFQNRNEEAILLMEKCFHLQSLTFGPDHPDTKSSFNALEIWKMEETDIDFDSA